MSNPEKPAYDATVPPIEEQLAEIWRDLPEEDWASFPPAATCRLDEYLYGGEAE